MRVSLPPANRDKTCRVLVGMAVLFAAIVVGRWWWLVATSPAVFFLGGGPGHWIQPDLPFDLRARFEMQEATVFRRQFEVPVAVERVDVTMRAFRRGCLWIDENYATAEPWAATPDDRDGWRIPRQFSLPRPLEAGSHVVYVLADNHGGPACFNAASDALGVRSDASWQWLAADGTWQPVRIATERPPLELTGLYPTVGDAMVRLVPWLVAVVAIVLAGVTVVSGRRDGGLSPAWLRMILLGVWIALCLNNLFRIPETWGFDSQGHLEYVHFIFHEGRLPLATDGWTMFQPPLFYLLAAALRRILMLAGDGSTADILLRLIPMACGAGLVELCHRIARVCFPGDAARQSVALLVGACMPIGLYQCQVVHNEPLAAVFIAASVLVCLQMLSGRRLALGRWSAAGLGGLWGLAILSKATAIMLGPFLIFAIVAQAMAEKVGWRIAARRVAELAAAAGLVAGWYHLRNWAALGRPFIGGWARGRGFDWWQDPGFRCSSQITDLGRSLVAPVYSGYWNLFDALHSTLWTDGFLSDAIAPPQAVPWNVDWLVVLSPLGLVPAACVVAGMVRASFRNEFRERLQLLFVAALVGCFVAAVVDLWIRLPIYSTCKGSYLLGLSPAFGVLAVAGCEPFLRWRWTRVGLLTILGSWAIAVHIAFWCVKF